MEDGRSRLSSTILVARVVSIAGHPFLLIPLTVAAATRSARWTAVVAAATVLPLTAVVLRNVRSGRWSDFDVSRHDQRRGLYRAAAPLLLACTAILRLLGATPMMLRATAAAAAMFLCGYLLNRWLKVSLHLMCAAFCAVLLGYAWTWIAVAAIGWSRRKLERHTMPEIVVGLVLGAGAGCAAVFGG